MSEHDPESADISTPGEVVRPKAGMGACHETVVSHSGIAEEADFSMMFFTGMVRLG